MNRRPLDDDLLALDGDLQGLGLGVDLFADADLARLDRPLLGVQPLFLDLDRVSRASGAARDVPVLEPGSSRQRQPRDRPAARVLMS